MKKVRLLALILSAVIALSACSDNSTSGQQSSADTAQSQSETSAPDNSEADSDAASEDSGAASEDNSAADGEESQSGELTKEQVYDNMVKRSLKSIGNTAAMTKFFQKLENGEETTVAFIGGSITEGLTAGPDLCWAKLTYDYLCEQYPNTKINYVNAGMSGTPSILGNIRLQRDVLDYNPDLVFVEFAVNDGMEQLYKDSYEALVRRVLSQPNQPAVALYFTVIKSGHTCEPHMSQIGEAYGLPMVSLNAVLKEEFDSGRMKWEDYSDDESHPNVWGHEMTRDLIKYMLEQVKANPSDAEIPQLPQEWVFGDRFDNMQFADRTHNPDCFKLISAGGFESEDDTLAQFPCGWYKKGKPSEIAPMEFEFTGSELMLVFRCANTPKYADLIITVDGTEVGSFATSKSNGWNNPDTYHVYSGEEGTHKVTIAMAPNDKDAQMYVEILGFGIA